MSISAISSGTSTYQTTQTNPFAKFKEDFDALGKALKSGNIDDAKKAYTQLQKDMPSNSSNNPMSSDLQTLGKALDSGNLTAAQDAYSTIQGKMSQGKPSSGDNTSGGTSSISGSSTNIGSSSGTTSTSSSSKVYDKKDTNKDGTVSLQEEMAYDLQHPADQTTVQTDSASTSSSNNGTGGVIDVLA
jgi:soluble cytochrome b562